jgi:hypothetical protein
VRYRVLLLCVLLAACASPLATISTLPPAPTPNPTARPEDRPYTAAAVIGLLGAGGLAVTDVQKFSTGDEAASHSSEQRSLRLAVAGTPDAGQQAAAVVVIFADRRDAVSFQRAVLAGGAPARVYTSGNALVYLPVPAPAAVAELLDQTLAGWESAPAR